MRTQVLFLASLGLVACTTVALPPAAEQPMQAAVPIAAQWEHRRLHYDRPYDQRRDEVERTLKRLGAHDVEGSHTQATCLVLVPARNDQQGSERSVYVAARWQRVTFHSERGSFNRRQPDGLYWVVYEQLKRDILRAFVTRNLDVTGRDSFSVEVLYPVTSPAE